MAKVRAFAEGDAEGCQRLRSLLWPDCPPERHGLEIEIFRQSPGIIALAEARSGELVGFAEVTIRRDHVEGTTAAPVPYLEGWFVDEAWRGQGIGRALVAFVEQWASAQGFHEIASDAELDNARSIAAHGALGFTEVGRGAFREAAERVIACRMRSRTRSRGPKRRGAPLSPAERRVPF